MRLSIPLFDGFTALDVVGGYECWRTFPAWKSNSCRTRSDWSPATPDASAWPPTAASTSWTRPILCTSPGGPGVAVALRNAALMACVRRLYPTSTWTVSICNGAEILGAAGLLKGKKVTTNWFAREHVAAYGALVGTERYQRDGKLITGAGVSASIKAGLFLAALLGGEQLVRTIQLGIE